MTVLGRFEPQVRAVREFCEDKWFDGVRRVQTSGEVSLRAAGVDEFTFRDSEAYQPARPAQIRHALRDTGIEDVSRYSYIDLGSGKGRSLFIAAEQPFRSITGVELSPRLHAIAVRNIESFRHRRRTCQAVQSLCLDATQYQFPQGPIVLYMFNPFGVSTVRQVLVNLRTSLQWERRHVAVVLLWPQWENEVLAVEGMQLRLKRREYQIYEAHREQV